MRHVPCYLTLSLFLQHFQHCDHSTHREIPSSKCDIESDWFKSFHRPRSKTFIMWRNEELCSWWDVLNRFDKVGNSHMVCIWKMKYLLFTSSLSIYILLNVESRGCHHPGSWDSTSMPSCGIVRWQAWRKIRFELSLLVSLQLPVSLLSP